ncbi:tripartite tricarboxylate transporter permease [Elioraea sp.]|uniref:tripartite tricarboxylate transporter permease n=1 Tax=Elioraea sp. TaxID=2185103 RepID=UPI0025BB123C|nr:tripartite tricarboxylate transporter permease [Elioraea sp.]
MERGDHVAQDAIDQAIHRAEPHLSLLTMGIPGNAAMAVLAGAMLIHGIQPGPKVITEQPALFWGVIASMWVGNMMLLVISLPLVGLWAKALETPYRVMAPVIGLTCCVGVLAVSNSLVALWLMLGFGIVGYALAKLGCEPAPMMLGFILGPLMEENFRRAMLISGGHAAVFVERPVSAVLLGGALLLLLLVVAPGIRRPRAPVPVER